MNPEEIKQKLHEYIDNASKEELEEMLYLLNEEDVEYGKATTDSKWWDDEVLIARMTKEADDIESGKQKGFSIEELHANISDLPPGIRKKT